MPLLSLLVFLFLVLSIFFVCIFSFQLSVVFDPAAWAVHFSGWELCLVSLGGSKDFL